MRKTLNFINGIDRGLKYLLIDTKNLISTKMELLLSGLLRQNCIYIMYSIIFYTSA